MQAILTPTDWKAVLETAITIAQEWDRERDERMAGTSSVSVLEGGNEADDRATVVRRHIELEIQTLEMLYARCEPPESPIEMPDEIECQLRQFLWTR